MKISFVLATINRVEENERFIHSLTLQSNENIELVIVDQNTDVRLLSLIEKFKESINIIYLKSEPGLSRARNLGIKYCSGSVIAFPDDDCWYPAELISEIILAIKTYEEFDIFTCQAVDKSYSTLSKQRKQSIYEILKPDVIGKGLAISFCLFFRKNVIDKVGEFNEEIGVGASTLYGAGEESDYLYRALNNGFRICHFPELQVFHPRKDSDEDLVFSRATSYGFGIGYVMKKNRVNFVLIFRLFLIRIILSLLYLTRFNFRNAAYYYTWAINLMKGWSSIGRE